MKKGMALFLLTVLMAAVQPASADVIWTPLDEYLSKCTYTSDKSFIIADPDGWAPVSDFPPDGNQIGILPNGTEIVTGTFCGPEGEQWTQLEEVRYPGADHYTYVYTEFVPAESLVPAYDSEMFVSRYADKILPFEEEYDFCGAVPFRIWKYPNAGVEVYEMDADHIKGCGDDEDIRERYLVDRVYTDPNGERWVTFELPYAVSFDYGWVNIGPAK